ncbi:hypothetical protein SDC9_160597 [bioreactor metagenome]|uniref:Uncharacterized protein n=1 Tax=bioreactor metagenome TaxID=1076179 RepID=A0A645FI25_9ZZZZ
MSINPKFKAYSFITLTNSSTLPLMPSAMAIAASFPDLSINPYISSSKLIFSPFEYPTVEPCIPADLLDISIFLSKSPYFNATNAVNILVVLAIGIIISELFSTSTDFEFTSKAMYARAFIERFSVLSNL